MRGRPGRPCRRCAGPVDPSEPQAKSLGYTKDATKVDAKANPNFKPGQQCANCLQVPKGKETGAQIRATSSAVASSNPRLVQGLVKRP